MTLAPVIMVQPVVLPLAGLTIGAKLIGLVMCVLRRWFWTVPSDQPTPVVVVAVNTLEPVSTFGPFWNADSFMPGNWAMISPLETVTTPLASVLAAMAGAAIASAATASVAIEAARMTNL